jgi:hypothetical protein
VKAWRFFYCGNGHILHGRPQGWILSVDGGYASRNVATGSTDEGVPVINSQEVHFEVAFAI